MAREWTAKEVDAFHKELILKLYHEFCRNQRDQQMWEAGHWMINKISETWK
jgi:hypothetical protein